ncbi:uncharacterized protein I206_103646 [Kwoniella pini CBS 10737]|uniref:Uncharacterized protein n=1 Tax=Kwoniella pini CBS 10737 TaxID=1296096 RepID=A0A1B9I990_9TREE|nr:uncharacterized protein I206_01351 [Kwoniella pini CBS 10737]OCF52067.1 hypothetical protein I206_01351 [Kwoniella pini CBS 10737]
MDSTSSSCASSSAEWSADPKELLPTKWRPNLFAGLSSSQRIRPRGDEPEKSYRSKAEMTRKLATELRHEYSLTTPSIEYPPGSDTEELKFYEPHLKHMLKRLCPDTERADVSSVKACKNKIDLARNLLGEKYNILKSQTTHGSSNERDTAVNTSGYLAKLYIAPSVEGIRAFNYYSTLSLDDREEMDNLEGHICAEYARKKGSTQFKLLHPTGYTDSSFGPVFSKNWKALAEVYPEFDVKPGKFMLEKGLSVEMLTGSSENPRPQMVPVTSSTPPKDDDASDPTISSALPSTSEEKRLMPNLYSEARRLGNSDFEELSSVEVNKKEREAASARAMEHFGKIMADKYRMNEVVVKTNTSSLSLSDPQQFSEIAQSPIKKPYSIPIPPMQYLPGPANEQIESYSPHLQIMLSREGYSDLRRFAPSSRIAPCMTNIDRVRKLVKGSETFEPQDYYEKAKACSSTIPARLYGVRRPGRPPRLYPYHSDVTDHSMMQQIQDDVTRQALSENALNNSSHISKEPSDSIAEEYAVKWISEELREAMADVYQEFSEDQTGKYALTDKGLSTEMVNLLEGH